MDQACKDTTMSDQECQMPKKIDDVVHVCSIVAMEARDKGCYLQETCNKAPESYQQKTRHESPGDVVTGHHAMLGDVPLLSSSCLASLVLMRHSYGLAPCARGVLSVGSIRDCPRRYHAESGSSSIVEISIPTTMGAVETELMVGGDKIKELRQRIFL